MSGCTKHGHSYACAKCVADKCAATEQALRAKVQELEAGWIAVKEQMPPYHTEVWIRGEGYEVTAILELAFGDPGEEPWEFVPRHFKAIDRLHPTHWRHVTPPTEDKSDG